MCIRDRVYLETLAFYVNAWGPDVLGQNQDSADAEFCHIVPACELPRLLPDFVEWFLARKVEASDEEKNNVIRWVNMLLGRLVERGVLSESAAHSAMKRASYTPEQLSGMLASCCVEQEGGCRGNEEIEGVFLIELIEPGTIYISDFLTDGFFGTSMKIRVPEFVSEVFEGHSGWGVKVKMCRAGEDEFQLLHVEQVLPT
eukprot:TRINITY_DN32842_c0_g1_i1.p1 TRINITY_DN32842_c0_g1~~TRINITY_DN32842_c0_g1_i1.p1  ORF type:complete len:200 (-),score=45.27 TRINITY_DN32842_c0_g1_i1:151-750(-)